MYSNIVEEGGGVVMSLKLHHLPIVDMPIKIRPLSTGIETEYKVESVSLIIEEVTTAYPGPPVASSDSWEHEWLVVVSVVE